MSVAAIAAIGVSLFLCGAFLVLFRNLSRTVAQWQQEVAVVVYLPRGVERAQVDDLRFVLDAPVWVRGIVEVDAAAAAAPLRGDLPAARRARAHRAKAISSRLRSKPRSIRRPSTTRSSSSGSRGCGPIPRR